MNTNTSESTNSATNSDMMGIGICTYGDYQMTDNLLTSIITKTDSIKDKDYTILVIDDGTPYVNILSNLENVCKKHKVRLIKNNENRGETYTINRLVQNLNTELITIFANDITVLESNWLKAIKYFLTQNDKIGAVGFPLEEGTLTKIDVNTPPRNIAEATGAASSFKKSVFEKVINPDGSIGFWEDYISFLEETHFNFKLVELGYYNYVLNWPSMAHTISSTFSKYPEVWLRTVDWLKIEKEINGSKNEYISTVKNSRMYSDENKIDSRIIYNIDTNNSNVCVEKVNRLQFSRYIFSKYWKLSHDDHLLDHNKLALKLFGNYYNPNTIKWLNGDMIEMTNENEISNKLINKSIIYAVTRCLYGEDFVQQAIKSIDSLMDKIFVFWDDKPYGEVDHCIYKGNRIDYPKKFDNIIEKIKELNNPKIILIRDHVKTDINQYTHLVNDYILPNYPKPNYILFLEVDMVFRKDQLIKAFEEFIKKDYLVAAPSQVEMWYDFNHRIPDRYRLGPSIWNMNKIDKMPPTGRGATLYEVPPFLNAYNHNFTFCVSKKAMYWKHVISIGNLTKDSPPNEDWYEEKWLKWDYNTNNKNLEISKGGEHEIPRANLYDSSQLPETIIKDFINKNIFKLL